MSSELKHPEGLKYLFAAEAWERFSFYGMKALLVFYMTKAFAYSDEHAYEVYASYTTLAYATPVLGGFIADRILGYRKAVLLGGVLMALGHFAMAFPGLFYWALALLICGNGFFKPNISTIVGRLYEQGDPRRDAGFTIFYMGINLGAGIAPLACGWLGEKVSWHLGFGLAGVGMLFGLGMFMLGRSKFHGAAEPPDPEKLAQPFFLGISRGTAVQLSAVLGVVGAWQLVQRSSLVGYLLSVIGAIVLAYLVVFLFRMEDKKGRDRLTVAIILTTISVVFWSFFEQAGSSMNLFADRNVDRNVLGFLVPASWFQSVNPSFILLCAPLFGWLWVRLARVGLEPSTALKFGFGILQLGLGFGALWVGAVVSRTNGVVGVSWLVVGYLLHTTGELCVSPIGLSMITKLSPPKLVGLMMGTWFLSSSFAQYVAGAIAALTGVSGGGEGGKVVPPPTETVMVYGSVFGGIAIAALVVGVLVSVVSPLLARRTHGVN